MIKRLSSIFIGVSFLASLTAGSGLAGPNQKIIRLTLCEGDTYHQDFVKTGAQTKGLKLPAVTNGNTTTAEGTMDAKGETLDIKAHQVGSTALTVEGQVPALNDAGYLELDNKYIITVINCNFTTGDWFRPKAEAKESPPPSDGNAHYRQPSAPFEFKSLGDDNCFDDSKSAAEYALSLVQAKASRAAGHWKDPTEVKEKNREFDVWNGAAERDLAANPAVNDELRADVKKWLKKFSTGRDRYYQRYDWKRGEASGQVLAFGGKAVDPGKTLTVMVLITGTQDCAKVGNEASKFKVFYAVLVGKFDLSDSGHDHHKSGGETKLAKIRQICCGLRERTPTGTTPKETPTPKAPETGTPKTVEKPPPVDKSKTFKSIAPGAALPNPDESSYLPSTAGPGSAIIATYVDPQQSGPSDAIVTLITDNGQEHNYKTKTDGNHKLKFTLPVKIAGALVTELLLHKGFKGDRTPDENAARCTIGDNATVPNTDPLPDVPSTGPAITRASTAYETTPGRNMIEMQTRGTNPLTVRAESDGQPLETRAASNTSVLAEANPDAPLGRHAISVVSDGNRSNEVQADFVKLTPEPLAPSQPGVEETLTVHIDGLGSDPATMTFNISGAATLAGGGSDQTVPVNGGVAQVRLRGTHAGAANVRFKLHVQPRAP